MNTYYKMFYRTQNARDSPRHSKAPTADKVGIEAIDPAMFYDGGAGLGALPDELGFDRFAVAGHEGQSEPP
jgi:hypothetical protein